MSARTKTAKQKRRDRMEAGIDRIAAALPNGELLLATDQPAFFELIAETLEVRGGPVSAQPFVFSIRPEYVTQILDGSKAWEFRTRRPSLRDDEMILIYETAPCSMIVGTALVPNIEVGEPDFLWLHLLHKGVTRTAYDRYFMDRAVAVAIHLVDVKRISPRPLPPGMAPPQSWSRFKGKWT